MVFDSPKRKLEVLHKDLWHSLQISWQCQEKLYFVADGNGTNLMLRFCPSCKVQYAL